MSSAVLPCGYCHLSFTCLQLLKNHINIQHKIESRSLAQLKHGTEAGLLNDESGRLSTTPTNKVSTNAEKINVESEFQCWPCKTFFSRESDLRRHLLQVHSTTNFDKNQVAQTSKTILTNEIKKSQLKNVSVQVTLEPSLQQHIFASTKDTKSKLRNGIKQNGNQDSWRCSFCEKSFQFQSRLKRHLIAHNSTNQNRPYECQVCQMKFLRPGDLWSHRKIHSGVKYDCDECGKKLSSSGSLHNHRISVHRSKLERFQCPDCPKSFSLKAKLKAHQMLKHSDQKPFSCQLCQKGYAQKQSLTSHLGSVHKIGVADRCNLCSKPFYDQAYLRKHLKWHQNVKDSKNDIKLTK